MFLRIKVKDIDDLVEDRLASVTHMQMHTKNATSKFIGRYELKNCEILNLTLKTKLTYIDDLKKLNVFCQKFASKFILFVNSKNREFSKEYLT